MTDTLRLTLLGAGASAGTPRINGDWGRCDPSEPRNYRTRAGLLVQRWRGAPGDPLTATTVLIDTSPDLRTQLIAARVGHVDGVIYSHDHADQTHGIDDLRSFYLNTRQRVPVWMDGPTRKTLRVRFGYCFEGQGGYPAILEDSGEVAHGQAIVVDGPGGPVSALPLAQVHGDVRSYGFRFGPAAYSNDLNTMGEESFAALGGLDLWMVDALQDRPHPSHTHLAQTLDWIRRLGPRHAVLVNMHNDLDYGRLKAELPAGVEPGYDGLAFDLAVPADSA